MRSILFVHNHAAHFVRLDLEELRKRYQVTELHLRSRRLNPFAIWREVKRHDLVFGWFASWHTWLPLEFAKRLGKPAVLVIGGYDLANMPEIGYGHQRGGLKKWISRRTMRLASCLITNSHYSREEAARNTTVCEAQVSVVYHGVPDPFKSLPQGARARMVLTVGNVDRGNLLRKGHEAFVRAAALMPDVNFVLAGAWADDAADHLRALATPNVKLTNRLSNEELSDYYRQASVYVQASLHEGFGMSVAEAMLAGCVPVVTRAGALPEVAGAAGVFLETPSPSAIAAGISKALTFPDEARAKIRQRILNEFPLETRGALLEQLIDPLMKVAPAGAMGRGSSPTVREGALLFNNALPDGGATAPNLDSNDTSAELPFVSVIMPVRNEANFIERSAGAVIAQDYPGERLEILIADGRSNDGTRELISALQAQHSNVKLIDNAEKIVAAGLNAALRQAKGEIIVRVDGHCEVAPDYVRRCVAHLLRDRVGAVGGPLETVGQSRTARAIAAAMSSRFGVGGSAFRIAGSETQFTDTVAFPAYRRSVLDLGGPFDEELVRNQDDEYNYRLRKLGVKILLARDVRSQYYSRATLAKLWSQYFQYGYWKVRVLQKHPRQMQLRQFVPPVFVLTVLTLMLLSLLTPVAQGLLVLLASVYAAALVLAACFTARKTGGSSLLLLPITFAALHLSYGSGFLFGLVRFWNRWGDQQTRASSSALVSDVAPL